MNHRGCVRWLHCVGEGSVALKGIEFSGEKAEEPKRESPADGQPLQVPAEAGHRNTRERLTFGTAPQRSSAQ